MSDSKTRFIVGIHTCLGSDRKSWASNVDEYGQLTGQRLGFDFGDGQGGDGTCLDQEANLWIAAGVNHPLLATIRQRNCQKSWGR